MNRLEHMKSIKFSTKFSNDEVHEILYSFRHY